MYPHHLRYTSPGYIILKRQMKQIILSVKIKNNKIVYKHVDNMYIFSNNYYIYNVPQYIKKKKCIKYDLLCLVPHFVYQIPSNDL